MTTWVGGEFNRNTLVHHGPIRSVAMVVAILTCDWFYPQCLTSYTWVRLKMGHNVNPGFGKKPWLMKIRGVPLQ